MTDSTDTFSDVILLKYCCNVRMSDFLSKHEIRKIDDQIKAEAVVDDVKWEVDDDNDHDHMCQECGAVYQCCSDLERHLQQDHDKRCYICPHCGISVEGNKNFQTHKRKHEMSTCERCSKSVRKDNLSRHMATCGQEAKAQHQCEDCGYTTSRFIGL